MVAIGPPKLEPLQLAPPLPVLQDTSCKRNFSRRHERIGIRRRTLTITRETINKHFSGPMYLKYPIIHTKAIHH